MSFVSASESAGGGRRYVSDDGSVEVREGGDRTWRNNNPGNLVYGSFARDHGAIGKDSAGFAIFPDSSVGETAMVDLIGGTYASSTLDALMASYAPPSENNTAAYQKFLSDAVGVPGSTVVKTLTPAQFSKLIAAIKKYEGTKTGTVTKFLSDPPAGGGVFTPDPITPLPTPAPLPSPLPTPSPSGSVEVSDPVPVPTPAPSGTVQVGDPVPVPTPTPGGDVGGGGGGGGGGCVAIESLLPDGRRAGDIRVDDTMELADEKTLEPDRGVVTYSQRKTQPGWRIVTQGGVTLRCSASAPIPTPEGLVLAPELLGKRVAVRRDGAQGTTTAWETVESVQAIGDIEVQHITVGDRCFWAGAHAGAFILHHNMKDTGGDDPTDWDWDDLKTGNSQDGASQPKTMGPILASSPTLVGSHALVAAMASFAPTAADAGMGTLLGEGSAALPLVPPQG